MSDMSHEQMLLDKYHKMVDNANNEAWKVEELEKKNKKLEEEIEKLKETNEIRFDKIKEMENEVGVSKLVHHQNLGLLEDNKKLKAENKELQEHYDNSIHTDWIAEEAGEDKEYYRDVCCAVTLGRMIKENKELKELTDGIMNEPGTGHILGCNAYEKFCQAMSELNYDEKWIGELMLETAENDTEEDILVSIKEEIKKLKQENKELKDYSKDLLGVLDKQWNGDQSTSSTISPKLCKSVYGYKGRKMKTRQSSEFRIRINDNKILYYKSPTNAKTPQPAVVTKLYEKDGNWFYARSSGHDRQFYDAVSDKLVNNHSLIDAAN